jgi:hypothetical protein
MATARCEIKDPISIFGEDTAFGLQFVQPGHR